MLKPVSRRSFLAAAGVTGAGLILGPSVLSQARAAQRKQAAGPGGLVYSLVNKTNGKFTDEECFWSLNGGREWHSFAKEPTAPRPAAGGLYSAVGKHPKNFDDWESYWDFVEYNAGGGTWHGNTTQVDAFCLPLTIEMGDKKVGIMESRSKLFAAFRNEAPEEFQACVKGDFWIVSPCKAGFGKAAPTPSTSRSTLTKYGTCTPRRKRRPAESIPARSCGEGALTFTPVAGGEQDEAIVCPEAEHPRHPPGRGRAGRQSRSSARPSTATWRPTGRLARPRQVLPGAALQLVLEVPPRAQHRPQVPTGSATTTTPNRPRFSGTGDKLVITLYWD